MLFPSATLIIGLLVILLILLIIIENRSRTHDKLLSDLSDSNRLLKMRVLELIEYLKEQRAIGANQIHTSEISPTTPETLIQSPPLESLPPPLPNTDLTQGSKSGTTHRIFKTPIEAGKETPKTSINTEKSLPTSQNQDQSLLGNFFKWLKEDWIMKTGSIMLILSIGWFTTYAFINNWIQPPGRIAIGCLLSLGLIILGVFRIKKLPNQGGVFLAVGTCLMILTMFWASNYYSILPASISLLITALTLIAQAKIAIANKSKALVYLSITLGAFAPFLFGYLGYDQFTLTYLLALILAIAYINYQWEQMPLPFVSSLIILLYSGPRTILEFNNWDQPTLIEITLVFLSVSIVIASALYALRNIKETQRTLSTLAIPTATICLISWSMKIGDDKTPGFIIAFYALISGVIAYLVFKYKLNTRAFYGLWVLSTLLAILSLHILFELPTLTIFLTIISIITVLIAHKVDPKSALPTYASILLALPSLAGLSSIGSTQWKISVFNLDGLAILILSTSLMGIGLWLKYLNKTTWIQEQQNVSNVSRALIILGSFYLYCLIWLVLSNTLPTELAIAPTLSIYTVIALICYFKGVNLNSKTLRVYGLTMLSLIIARLLLIDLWDMNVLSRILTFFAVGALLISTAFFGRKNKK
jgi:uncharacterized membrane protein